MKTKSLLQAAALLTTLSLDGPRAHADPASSAAYSIPAQTISAGQARSQSALYANHGTTEPVGGTAQAPSPNVVSRHGFMGQLYEVTALQLAASSATMNEAASQQLGAVQLLDDLTLIAVPPASITWSISGGPLSIQADGVAAASAVFQNTAAVVQGIYAGQTGTMGLTVLDTIPDNFGTYAGDGIGDDWQVQYFGQNNPGAAPALDPDGDGLRNLLEFATGLNPTSPSLIAVHTIKNGGSLEFTYERAVAALGTGVAFLVEWSDTLAGSDWHAAGVTESILSANATTQQIKATIPAGLNGQRFVRLRVTGP